ncbi:hypothetical protein OROGR_012946 [Orobanche gracilis]
MAEDAKVRLVRCPKCENLLPELPDISLYQCGGCGTVLKAKQKGIMEDGLPEISDAVRGRLVYEESNTVKVPDVKMESADNMEVGILETPPNEVMASDGSSKSRPESTEALTDCNRTRRIRNLETSGDEYTSYSRGLIRNRNLTNHRDSNMDVPEYVKFHGDHVKDVRPPMEPLRPMPIMDQWGLRTDGPSCGPAGGVSAQMRFDNFHYYDEGQSSHETNSYYGRGETTSKYWGPDSDGLAQMENLENGRAELIRRLDELKDQISRSCDIPGKSKERTVSSSLPDPYVRRQTAYNYQENSNKQPLVPDAMIPSYFTEPRGCIPNTADKYNLHALDPYPERRYPHEFTHCSNNAYKSDILQRPPSGSRSQYIQHHPYRDHVPGYYGDINHDLFMLHRHENFFHQPACSCVHCCDKSWHMPPKVVDPQGLHNRRFHNEPSNPNLHRNLNPSGPQKSLSMKFNDPVSQNDGFKYRRPRKFVVTNRSGRVSRPVAGGAPFIACGNCFEVLKLPKKRVLSGENRQKLKCGACSSIILFEFGDKVFITSASVRVDQEPTEIDEGSSGTLDENVRYWNGGSNSATNLNTSSNDYDDFGDKFLPTGKKSNSFKSEKHLNRLLSASSLSEDEQGPEKLPGLTAVKSSPDQDSTDENIPASHFDKRNKSQRSEPESASLDWNKSRPNAVKDAGAATEIDVPSNEFPNSCTSHDSVERSREAKLKANKGSESFLAGLIKKSFKDFKKPNQCGVEVGGSQVFVNGHFLPDRVVKRAEKLAGPIQPGKYWYDKLAGFWGVMGHPCLGIIMPNIEEFDYPMPRDCAAGNTKVFVNGRELHQKDFDLLSSRGLPITRNRSYVVEITGKVIDEETGQELDGLGKLAPTVERSKHGFGMKVPRFLAQTEN